MGVGGRGEGWGGVGAEVGGEADEHSIARRKRKQYVMRSKKRHRK